MNLLSTETDAELLPALREVRGKGIALELMGTLPAGVAARTAEEKLMGTFWACGGAAELETPPRLYALVNVARGTRGFWLGTRSTGITSGGRWFGFGKRTVRWVRRIRR